MKTIPTKTTYLEMRSANELAPIDGLAADLARGIAIERLDSPSAADYRELYRGVGERYHWVDRLLMVDGELERIVQDPRVEVHVLRVDGQPAGYAELDRRQEDEIEIAYFGLFPSFVGQGLGKYLLRKSVAIAWTYRPQRVWLHTCDLDHPAALSNYLKAGFKVYDVRVVQQPVFD
jgi:GNAT superfamily N-acetyltransferase